VTTVAFTLGQGGEARLRIFNLAGRQVREFVQRAGVAGRQQVRWDGRDEDGNRLASGIYFYQVESGKLSVTRKLVLMR
jgi:flagellar hook assembly protein FlgD